MTIDKCPCCGGNPFARATRRMNKNDCEGFYIMCKKCGLETAIYDTLAEAVTAWNRRYKSEIHITNE